MPDAHHHRCAPHARRSYSFSDLDLVVPRGDCAAIVGPNGAGKSTLLRCVVDEDRLDAGSIAVFGMVPDETSTRFRAAVSAEIGAETYFFDATLTEHLELLARTHRMAVDENSVLNALTGAGLGALGDRFPHTLSTGQRQRFALTAALFRPADLVVLDEPERGLDAQGQHWVAAQITAVCNRGAAVLMATHSTALTDACADTVVTLG